MAQKLEHRDFNVIKIMGEGESKEGMEFLQIAKIVSNFHVDSPYQNDFIETLQIENISFSDAFEVSFLKNVKSIRFDNCDIPEISHSFNDAREVSIYNCRVGHFSSQALFEAGHINISECIFENIGEFDSAIDIRKVNIHGNINITNCKFGSYPSNISVNGGKLLGDLIIKGCEFREGGTGNAQRKRIYIDGIETIGIGKISDCQVYGSTFFWGCNFGSGLSVDKCNFIVGHKEDAINDERLLLSIKSCKSKFIDITNCKTHSLLRIDRCKVDGDIFASDNNFNCGQVQGDNLANRNAFSVVESWIGGNFTCKRNRMEGGFAFYGSTCSRVHFGENTFSWRNAAYIQPNLISRTLTGLANVTLGRRVVRKFQGWPHDASHYNISFANSNIIKELNIYEVKVADQSIPYFWFQNCSAGVVNDSNFEFPTIRKMNINFENFIYKDIRLGDNPHSFFSKRIRLIKSHGRTPSYFPTSAQPFFHLSKVLQERGEKEIADRAIIESARATTRQIRTPASFILRSLFDLLFGYGLSRTKAIITLVIWVSLGAWGTSEALERNMFVIDTQRVASASLVNDEGSIVPATPVVNHANGRIDEFHCKDQIIPVFYAIESIIPVIEFGQVKQCILRLSENGSNHSRNEVVLWWGLRIFYIVGGWILASISIMTFSGLLRNPSS